MSVEDGVDVPQAMAGDPNARDAARIRTAINSAAAGLVKQVFEAADMHVTSFDPKLLAKVITTNAFSRAEIERQSAAYDILLSEEGLRPGGESHVFCTLYVLGLLGVVYEDAGESGRRVQHFKPAGWAPLGVQHVLPMAETYVIHPALSDYIAQQDYTYLSRINKYNIVGDGLEWYLDGRIQPSLGSGG